MVGILQDDEEQTNSLRRNKMNKMMKWSLAVACAVISTGSVMAQGDGGPLIDALVKKGVLSSQEGEEIRADMTADLAATPGGMITWGSSAVRGVKIYGDARMRYQWENKQDQTASNPNQNADRNRYRYRIRLGADYQFAENWNAGVRLETSTANDSTNNNFGGYFDKTGDEIYVGLVYLQYATSNPALFGFEFADSFKLTMGKQKTPFLLSNAFWDSDINPEGFSEEIGWTNVFTDGFDVTLRGGQYVVSEENNSTLNTQDGFLFVAQAEARYSWASKTYAKVAPMFISESAGTFLGQENGGTVAGENGIAQLGHVQVIAVPVEVAFNAWSLKHKFFGTYGINLEGDQLARRDYGIPSDENDLSTFFNVGYQMGKGKGKGAWQIGAEYRYIEAGAYTTNLSDSDFAKNENNQQGVVLSAGYSFTDNISGGVTWFHSSDIDKGIDVGTSDANTADILQVDLSWRF